MTTSNIPQILFYSKLSYVIINSIIFQSQKLKQEKEIEQKYFKKENSRDGTRIHKTDKEK